MHARWSLLSDSSLFSITAPFLNSEATLSEMSRLPFVATVEKELETPLLYTECQEPDGPKMAKLHCEYSVVECDHATVELINIKSIGNS